MTAKINQVLITWEVSDGRHFELVYEGENENIFQDRKILDPFPRPLIKVRTTLKLDYGSRVILEVNDFPYLLPDRSGVFTVFSAEIPARGNFAYFPPPHNAAIFNADGSLRFQLKNPVGEDGIFRAVVSLSLPDGSRGLGVRACPKAWPTCEDVYIIDGDTDDLSKKIPRWMRD
jgi:hypothetical protein